MAWSTPPTFVAGMTAGVAAALQKLSDDLKALGGGGLEILRGSASLDFPSIGAQARQVLDITVTGAVTGDDVTVHPDSSLTSGLVLQAWVTAADTVRVAAINYTGSAIDPTAFTVRVNVLKFH